MITFTQATPADLAPALELSLPHEVRFSLAEVHDQIVHARRLHMEEME